MKLIKRYSVNNPSYRANVVVQDERYATFQKRGPVGLVLHSIGVAQPSAVPVADYFNRADTQASVHAILQADGTVYQTLPWNYRAWHVGGTANNTHLGVEMCEPGSDAIYYDRYSVVHISNREKALAYVRASYAIAVELFAQLCVQYGLNPLGKNIILSHSECYRLGLGSDHADPEHLWNALASGLSMNGFRRDVADRWEDMTMTQAKFNEMLRVAQKRMDTLSQVPQSLRQETQELIRLGVLQGVDDSGRLDISMDQLRCMIVALRLYKLSLQNVKKNEDMH